PAECANATAGSSSAHAATTFEKATTAGALADERTDPSSTQAPAVPPSPDGVVELDGPPHAMTGIDFSGDRVTRWEPTAVGISTSVPPPAAHNLLRLLRITCVYPFACACAWRSERNGSRSRLRTQGLRKSGSRAGHEPALHRRDPLSRSRRLRRDDVLAAARD